MKHFHDLPSLNFLQTLFRFHECVITEKLDGCNLIFIKKDNSIMFSRERKCKLKNAITFSDFDERNPYHLPFIGSMKFLEKMKDKLPEGKYEVEILFGKVPNVIEYDKETEEVVVLHRIDDEKIHYDIEYFDALKDVAIDVVLTNPLNGRKFSTTWKLKTNRIYQNDFDIGKIETEIKELKKICRAKHSVFDVENAVVETINLNKKPSFVHGNPDWKRILKQERESIQEAMTKIKRNICENILRHFVKDGEETEGIAVYIPVLNETVKITTENFRKKHEKFSKLNRKYPFLKWQDVIKEKDINRYRRLVNRGLRLLWAYHDDCFVYDTPYKHFIFNLSMWKNILERY